METTMRNNPPKKSKTKDEKTIKRGSPIPAKPALQPEEEEEDYSKDFADAPKPGVEDLKAKLQQYLGMESSDLPDFGTLGGLKSLGGLKITDVPVEEDWDAEFDVSVTKLELPKVAEVKDTKAEKKQSPPVTFKEPPKSEPKAAAPLKLKGMSLLLALVTKYS
jgi:hypothetical protein